MQGTIYDFRTSPLLDLELPSLRPAVRTRARPMGPAPKVGLIRNPRSKRHLPCDPPKGDCGENLLVAIPRTRAELRTALFDFAAQGIDLLVIDGGDGTVRDVLTCAEDAWGAAWPRIAVLPSGKTNALALDLGVPLGWSLDDAVAAARRGRTAPRSPIEIERLDAMGGPVRGFLFGTGAFVKGTEFAQRTHKMGALDGVAVTLALVWGVASMLVQGAASAWCRPSAMGLTFGRGSDARGGTLPAGEADRVLLFASTLQRLPAGLKPFGTPRPGLKTLVVDTPRRLAASLPLLLAGSESAKLAERGYTRVDTDRVEVNLSSPFILDGEEFPAGDYVLRRGAPLRFVVP